MRLTDRALATLSAPDRGQKLYSDDLLPGFGIRVSQGGAKTFVLTFGAKRHRLTIGRYPIVSLSQARDKAKTILAERQLGIRHLPTPPFADIADEYADSRVNRIRAATGRADTAYRRCFSFEERIGDITAAAAQKAVDDIHAPSMRFHAFVWLKALFRFAVRRGYIYKSPLDALDAPSASESRARVLTPEELGKLLATARIWRLAGNPFGSIIELLTLTGQRRTQIGALQRSYVDFEQKTITWPPEAMKTGKRHTIPFGPTSQSVLNNFPYRRFTAWSHHLVRFRADCGFEDWVLHDLRRTLATRWQEMGIEIATTEKMLSHSAITGGLVGVYQRSSYLAQMRNAVLLWENYLQALLSTTEGVHV